MESLTVTVNEARNALGLGATKIYELINDKRLKTIKIGRRTLITTESIRNLIEECLCEEGR